MVQFTTAIKKFAQNGEKTGWSYIDVPAEKAQQLKPGNKKSFRVKGYLDDYPISAIALLPMGNGHFIMPLNAVIRKGIRKAAGTELNVQLQLDKKEIKPPAAFIECLKDEPAAFTHFQQLPKSHQNYFTHWIESAKTELTKAKRIAQAVTALSKGQHFGMMIRSLKNNNTDELF